MALSCMVYIACMDLMMMIDTLFNWYLLELL